MTPVQDESKRARSLARITASLGHATDVQLGVLADYLEMSLIDKVPAKAGANGKRPARRRTR